MAVTYTTEAKVRQLATDYTTSPPTDAITDLIYHAEAIVDATTQFDWKPKWNATKLYLIEAVTGYLAAGLMIASDPNIATTNSEAALMMDYFWAAANRILRLLKDDRIIKYLKLQIGAQDD